MLTGHALTLALVAVAGAGIVTGLTGFGFALVSVPLLLLVMPPASVVTAVLVIGWMTSTVNALTSRRHVEPRLLAVLLPTSLIGMIVGGYALRWIQAPALKLIAALLVITFTLLLAVRRRPGRPPGRRGQALVGAASGVLTTSVGLSGPPVVLLMSAALPDKHRSRATLAAYFALTSPLGLATLLLQGNAPSGAWTAAAVLVPVALLGRFVGSRLHRRTPPVLFRGLTLGITLAAGLGGLASALSALLGRG